jgi:hypothetical protein
MKERGWIDMGGYVMSEGSCLVSSDGNDAVDADRVVLMNGARIDVAAVTREGKTSLLAMPK